MTQATRSVGGFATSRTAAYGSDPSAFRPSRELTRPARYEVQTDPRERPENVKEQIVEQREFENIRLLAEYVAEFRYRPGNCAKEYRMIVVKKDVEVTRGQQKLFDKSIFLFYITNKEEPSPEQIVFTANGRCNQENLIEQHKNAVRSLTAPLDSLESNWAYMVITALAWSLKAWAALLVPVNPRWNAPSRGQALHFSTFGGLTCHVLDYPTPPTVEK